MSGLFRTRNLAIGAGFVAVVFFVPKFAGPTNNVFETTASKSIGDRWSSGGGTDVHTPGAATRRGSASDTRETQANPTGMGSKHFQENQASQRPGEPGTFDKAWNKAHYGTEKGK